MHSLVHYQVSVARLAKEHTLGPAHVAATLALWGCSRDPFARAPVVTMSVPHLASLIGVSESYMTRVLKELDSIAFQRTGRGGQVRRYRMLRPEHVEADELDNPFAPRLEVEPIAGLPASRKAKRGPSNNARKEQLAKVGLQRSDIASRLERVFNLPKPLYFTSGEVNSAIDFLFGDVCEGSIEALDLLLAAAAADPDKPSKPERLFYSSHSEWRDKLVSLIVGENVQ